jgi:hypothetical protein
VHRQDASVFTILTALPEEFVKVNVIETSWPLVSVQDVF